MPADLRAHLEAGGLVLLAPGDRWEVACLVASEGACHALQARGPVGVAFSSWLEARLFVDAPEGASAAADALLPGPLALVCATSGFGLEAFERPGGGLEVHVPADGVLRALLEELGPMLVQPLGAAGDGAAATVAAARDGLACLVVPGEAGLAGPTVVDARGPAPVVLLEGVIPTRKVVEAWRTS